MPLRVIQHYSDWVCTAVMSKWRHERSSRLIRNLSNCVREAWKKFRLQRDSNPWPLRYRCSALPTELWSHNCWEQVNFSGSIMPLRVIQHYSDWVCTAVMSKWRHERSSRLIRNLSNCVREAWKKFRLQRDSNPWPLRYRCSALPTELWSHNCWEQVNFSGSIMPLRVVQWLSRLTRDQETWVQVPVGAFNQFFRKNTSKGKKKKRCPYTYMYVPFHCHICVSSFIFLLLSFNQRNFILLKLLKKNPSYIAFSFALLSCLALFELSLIRPRIFSWSNG